jgi:hypothetical protein
LTSNNYEFKIIQQESNINDEWIYRRIVVDYREDTFRRKFDNAAREFGVVPNQVVSLKLRDNVHDSEYNEFFKLLEREMGLSCLAINAELQGRGYLISDRRNRVILVRHESGPEILSIAGDISSIICLVVLIFQGWRFLHSRLQGRPDNHLRGIEIRRIDQNGKFSEEHMPDFEMNSMIRMGLMNPALTSITHLLENEMNALAMQVKSLTVRVEKLEKLKVSKTKKRLTINKKPIRDKKS